MTRLMLVFFRHLLVSAAFIEPSCSPCLAWLQSHWDLRQHVALSAQCLRDMDSNSHCRDYKWIWYFRKEITACKTFCYDSCGGNENLFLSENECLYTRGLYSTPVFNLCWCSYWTSKVVHTSQHSQPKYAHLLWLIWFSRPVEESIFVLLDHPVEASTKTIQAKENVREKIK